MPKLDKLKEELGWLKIVFGIFIATDLSIMAWLVQNYMHQNRYLVILSAIVIIAITASIVYVNEIGEL